MLYISGFEDRNQRLIEVNSYRHNNSEIKLIDLNDYNRFPDVFPRYLYAATINHLDIKSFLSHISLMVKWKYPEYIQLIISEEDYSDCSFYVFAGKKLIYKANKM
ncbi:MAG: hypothetical protein IPL95_06870 [Saprospiraceae bacterium]|nr:hypothetical protein [Saprospiraceae bacterium]